MISFARIVIVCALVALPVRGAPSAPGENTIRNPIVVDVKPPELVGGPWLNTPEDKPVRLADRRGEVTIVHFWTFGCINCQRNLPAYARWQKRFEKDGAVIIGVHTPETEAEKDFANVRREVERLGITYPVLFDLQAKNWARWQQHYWPTVYLLDRRGHVRAYWVGELEWNDAGGEAIMARKIEGLLREGPQPEKDQKDKHHTE